MKFAVLQVKFLGTAGTKRFVKDMRLSEKSSPWGGICSPMPKIHLGVGRQAFESGTLDLAGGHGVVKILLKGWRHEREDSK